MHEDQDEVPVEQLLLSNTFTIQAIINVLERRGVATRAEILEELQLIESLVSKDEEEEN